MRNRCWSVLIVLSLMVTLWCPMVGQAYDKNNLYKIYEDEKAIWYIDKTTLKDNTDYIAHHMFPSPFEAAFWLHRVNKENTSQEVRTYTRIRIKTKEPLKPLRYQTSFPGYTVEYMETQSALMCLYDGPELIWSKADEDTWRRAYNQQILVPILEYCLVGEAFRYTLKKVDTEEKK